MYETYIELFNKFNIPQILAVLSWPVIQFIGVAVLLIGVVIFLVLMERKILALLTVRKGPNRVGPWGVFQTIADAIKLLIKEDIMSKGSNKVLFTIAPVIFFVPVMTVYCIVPFSGKLIAANLAIGLLMVLAISSVSTIGIVLAGWASNNKYSLIGGMRGAAQAISYEIPLVISALAVALLAGSMDMQNIVAVQSGGIHKWFLWPSLIGCVIFFICSMAEINRVPFDLPEAESELVSGYNTEYSGMKFALFFLAEYAALFVISVVFVTLFLGGYLPIAPDYISNYLFANIFNKEILQAFVHLEQVFWLTAKIYFVIFVMMWVRATLPRLRADQLMSFSWKFLLPLSLANLFIVAVYRYFFPL